MECFLLPTSEIVQEFRTYDHLFCFYAEGVKGLVRDCLKLGTGQPITEDLTEAFIDFVMYEYEQSLHLRYLENTLRSAPPEFVIGSIVSKVEDTVQRMMQTYFKHTLYEVRRADQWMGDDLIASIVILEHNYDTKPFNSGLFYGDRCV